MRSLRPGDTSLTRRAFRAAMLEVERAVFLRGLYQGKREELLTIARDAAIRAGMSSADLEDDEIGTGLDRLVIYVLERRAFDPLSSRVLHGSIGARIRWRRWREQHADRDREILEIRKRELLSQRELAERFGLTRKQVRGAIARAVEMVMEGIDDVGAWLREHQRRWLVSMGYAPPGWKSHKPPHWTRFDPSVFSAKPAET